MEHEMTLPNPWPTTLVMGCFLVSKLILIPLLEAEHLSSLLFQMAFGEDLLFSLILYFMVVTPVHFWPDYKKRELILTLLMASIIFFQVSQIRFMLLFGAPLSYGMLQQLHGLSDFVAGVLSELDLSSLVLTLAALLLIFLLHKLQRKNPMPISIPKPKIALLIGTAFGLSLLVSFYSNNHPLLLNKNFQSYFILSFFQNSLTATPDSKEGTQLSIQELLQAKNPVQYNPVRLSASVADRKRLNVVFYTLESTIPAYTDLNKDQPRPLTPNIKKLANHAFVLQNHYSPEPASIKALYAILTGKLPPKTDDWFQFQKHARNQQSLASILKKSGYENHYIFSGNGKTYYQKKIMQATFDSFIDKADIDKRKLPYQDFSFAYDDRVLIQLTREFLNQKRDNPFFLVINTVFPHHPYLIPDGFKKYVNEDTRWAKYQNSLHFADFVLGQVYQVFEDMDMADNTLFVLHSDHGEAFFQHRGNSLHSLYVYEENVNTLALFINKKLFPERIDYLGTSSHIDLLPTTMDILRKQIPQGVHGQSLVRAHQARLTPVYTAFSHNLFGVVDHQKKIIFNYTNKAHEYFDLKSDPAEKKNVFKNNGESAIFYEQRINRLRQRIQQEFDN